MIGWAFETLIASTLLMGFVLLLRERVAAAFGPRIAYLLWLLPLARMLLPHLPQAARPPVSLPLDLSAIDAPMAGMAGPAFAQPVPPAVPGLLDWLADHWPLLVLIVWLGGAIVHFCWQIGLYRRFLYAALRGSSLLCRTCGIAIHRGPHVGGPAAVGIVHRRILLPADFTSRYDPAERRLVLAHEIAHHVRGDLIANGAALAMLSLHWFNPLAHRAYRAFRADQELACDATVLAHEAPELRPVYGAALVKSVHAATPAAACAIGSAQMLKRRLKMMATPDRSRLRRIGGGLLATATIVGGLGLTASGGVAAPSRLPGVQLAVMQMDGASMSFDHDNASSMHAAAFDAAPVPAPAMTSGPARPIARAPKPVRTAEARRVNVVGVDARSDDARPAPPGPLASPPPVTVVPPAPPAPPVYPDFAEIRRAAQAAEAEGRAAAVQARIAGREAAEAGRKAAAEARVEAGRARAEAARTRVENAAQVRAALTAARVGETVAAAMAQARVQLAASCRYARPAVGPENDRQAVARLSAGCVDYGAINAQLTAAFKKAREGLRAAQMSEDARERAIDAMDRAIERMEDREID